jgi:hypothetical protein
MALAGIIIALFFHMPTGIAIMLAVIIDFFAGLLIGLVKYAKIKSIGSIDVINNEEGAQRLMVIAERYDLIRSVIQVMAYALIVVLLLLFFLAQGFISKLFIEYLNLEYESPHSILMLIAVAILLFESGKFILGLVRYLSIVRVPPTDFWENYARYEKTSGCLDTWRQWGGGPVPVLHKLPVLPSYELSDDSVIIDLRYLSAKDYKFRIGFDELDEIRQFSSSIETKAFLNHTVGPNPNFFIKSAQDEIRYMKGKIPRPTVYISRYSDAGQVVFLRGPELFYVFEFNTDDVSDLIEAFQNFKAA